MHVARGACVGQCVIAWGWQSVHGWGSVCVCHGAVLHGTVFVYGVCATAKDPAPPLLRGMRRAGRCINAKGHTLRACVVQCEHVLGSCASVGQCAHAWGSVCMHGSMGYVGRGCAGVCMLACICWHVWACMWGVGAFVGLCVNAWGRERGRITSSQPKAPGLRPIEKVGLAAEARP